MKIKFKVNDTVKMITGKNKGKSGKVTQVLRGEEMVVVEGLNKMYKYLKSQRKGEKGQRIEFAAPVAFSKVMLICPTCNKPTRVGTSREGEKKNRVCKKCKAAIE